MNQVGGNLPVIVAPLKTHLDDYRYECFKAADFLNSFLFPGFRTPSRVFLRYGYVQYLAGSRDSRWAINELLHTSLILVCFWSAPAPAARVWVALEYLFYLIKISKQVPNTSTGTFIHPKLKFQIFYFRVYNILHTTLLLQLEREDKWFCGRMNAFKYKIRIRNSNTYRYRTNFLTFRAVNEGRIMRSPVNIF